jgi:hypothetical protein
MIPSLLADGAKISEIPLLLRKLGLHQRTGLDFTIESGLVVARIVQTI